MVEISLSGSGEGPGWETSRPTLQRYFCSGVSGCAPPAPHRLDATAPRCPATCACRAARWRGSGCVSRVPRGREPWNGWQAGREDGTRACTGAQVCKRPSRRARRRQDHAGVGLVEHEYLWATTGGCNGRWDGRELEMPQDARDHRLLGDDSNDPECTTSAKGTRGHIQAKDAAQQPGPRPVRGARVRLCPVQPLLARGGTDRPTQVAVRREAAPIAHQMDVWQRDQRRELLQEFQRRKANPRGAVGPRMGESIDELAVGVCLEALQRHGTTGGIADEAFQLIAPMRRNLGVGVQGKAVDTRTPRSREGRPFSCRWCFKRGYRWK